MIRKIAQSIFAILASLKTTIVSLVLLMALVFMCTLAQVKLGTYGAVREYMRSFLVWWEVPGTAYSIPVFPGGILVGALFAVNLVVAQVSRLGLTWRKSGLWIAHAGLILLVTGEFITAIFQVDTQMSIEEGQTVDFVESTREMELVVTDSTDPQFDDVYGVPEALLAKEDAVPIPGSPLTLRVTRFMRNAQLSNRGTNDPPSLATMGVGASAHAVEVPAVTKDDELNQPAVFVEPQANGRSFGIWLVSSALGAPQFFVHEGHTYTLAMHRRRQYLPYAITLKDFRHDVYPGTDIPKNFSSLIRLDDPSRREARDVLVYMNQPLRYAGKTFYQSSFGKNDTLSIFQVVENPGWVLPYVSCVLVTLGLLIHFMFALRRAQLRRVQKA